MPPSSEILINEDSQVAASARPDHDLDAAGIGGQGGVERTRRRADRVAAPQAIERALERRDLPRHRALRQRQLVRGACVALVARCRIEAAQGLQRGDLAGHDMLLEHSETPDAIGEPPDETFCIRISG